MSKRLPFSSGFKLRISSPLTGLQLSTSTLVDNVELEEGLIATL